MNMPAMNSQAMKISVIGCGYLGAVHAATLASMGHSVVGIDVDAAKVADTRKVRSAPSSSVNPRSPLALWTCCAASSRGGATCCSAGTRNS